MKLHEQVERLWALESNGFRSDGTSNSLEGEKALEILKRTTKLKDERYEVGLLWRNDNPELPNNRIQAEKRLQQLKRRFQLSPEFAAQYKTVIMNDYIEKGFYAKKLSEEEAARTSSHTWYLPIERAFGPQWNIDTDTFGVKTSPTSGRPGNDTRRRCLSRLSSIFDPLVMIGPVLLPSKRVFLQTTWQLNLHWDETLPEDLLKDWNKWKEDLTLLNHMTIPRCYFPGGCSLDETFQLHYFSDASEVGYGKVSYLRRETVDGRVDCSFIMAKSRTTPLQFVYLPRPELQAATIVVRMHRLILKEIDLVMSASFF